MKGVIYARYSPGPEQTEASIEGQVADCKAYAAREGINIVGVYADRAVSGRSMQGRLEFQQMIQDAERGLFECVIVWKIDRFGRNRYDIAVNRHKLKQTGVKLYYAKESIPDGPEGIVLEAILEGMAEYYSADLAQKISRGYRENAKKGVWTFALPLGYTRDKDRHVIKDATAYLIKDCFEMYAAGTPMTELADYLTAHGLTGQRGAVISKSVMSRILRNRRYLGEFECQGIVYEGIEPIVSVELFETVQRMLPKKEGRRHSMNYLLSGKCKCAYCGRLLRGESGTSHTGKTYHYYKCGTKKNGLPCELSQVARDTLDAKIINATMEHMLTDELIDDLVEKIMEIQGDNGALERAESALRSVKTKIGNVVRLAEQSGSEALLERLAALEQEKADLEYDIVQARLDAKVIPAEEIRTWLESFRHGDKDSEAFRARLVDTFIARIVVSNDEIVVFYNTSNEGSTQSLQVDLKQLASNPYGVPTVVGRFICLKIEH